MSENRKTFQRLNWDFPGLPFLPGRGSYGAIYLLVDPRNECVVYVGQTINPEERLRFHTSGSLKWAENFQFCAWKANLRKCGLQPALFVVDGADSKAVLHLKEKAWIAYFRRIGRLYNIHDGGLNREKTLARKAAKLAQVVPDRYPATLTVNQAARVAASAALEEARAAANSARQTTKDDSPFVVKARSAQPSPRQRERVRHTYKQAQLPDPSVEKPTQEPHDAARLGANAVRALPPLPRSARNAYFRELRQAQAREAEAFLRDTPALPSADSRIP